MSNIFALDLQVKTLMEATIQIYQYLTLTLVNGMVFHLEMEVWEHNS